MKKFWKFIKDEEGLETVEYAIIASLVVIGLIATLILLGGHVCDAFVKLDSAVTAGS